MNEWLQNNSDLLLALGGGLLGGRNAQEQLAGGIGGIATFQKDKKQKNKTIELLQAQSPELVQAIEAGILSPADAFTLNYKERAERAKAQLPNRKFQTLPDGTYGWSDENAGSWTPIGKAPRGAAQKEDPYDARRRAAEANGLSTDNPAYQSFILTGKMPREDQSPLTATDKKAILEADEMVLSNKTAIDNLKSVLDDSKGKSLNDRASYGFGSDLQSWAARNDPTGFFNDEKGQATTELNNVITGNTLGQLKSIFGGNPTEGERTVLRELEASSEKSPTERKAILDRAVSLAERRLEFNQQRADELRGGTFYKPQGGMSSQSGGVKRTQSGQSWKVVE